MILQNARKYGNIYYVMATIPEVQFIMHGGKRILRVDFAHKQLEDLPRIMQQVREVVSSQPPGSVYTLTDVTGTSFNTEITEAMKRLVADNKPYVAAAAVVGVTGLKQVILNAITRFTGRRLYAFDDAGAAKDWLASL